MRASAFADHLWDACQLRGAWPHEVLPGLRALDDMRALRLLGDVKRSRLRWRRYQVEEMLRSLRGDKDPMGVGRVIALLAAGEVGG